MESAEQNKPARKIRALVTNDVVHYPHNDLSDAASFIRERLIINRNGTAWPGATYVDVMALTVLVAFSLEGYVNFVGERLIRRDGHETTQELAWKAFDRASVRDKIKLICKLTGTVVDWNKRPYSTVEEIKRIRDLLAHPKAHRPELRQYEAIGEPGELQDQLRDYVPMYARSLTLEFAERAQDDVQEIWLHLLATANIKSHEAYCGGSQGIEYLGEAD